jgi:hypothetical protein
VDSSSLLRVQSSLHKPLTMSSMMKMMTRLLLLRTMAAACRSPELIMIVPMHAKSTHIYNILNIGKHW